MTKSSMRAKRVANHATNAMKLEHRNPMRWAPIAVNQARKVSPAAIGWRINAPVRACNFE